MRKQYGLLMNLTVNLNKPYYEWGRRFQDKSEKVRKERQLKPGTKALHRRSNQGLVQINCLKTAGLLKAT